MSTIQQILNESPRRKVLNRTYEDLDKITRKIGQFINAESKKQTKSNFTLDITNSIPKEFNPFNKKVILKYSNIKVSKKKAENHVISSGNSVNLFLFWHDTFTENWTRKGRTYLTFVTLKHEVVHILDYLEMTGNEADYENNKSISASQDLENSVTYYKDPFEFNQIINVIKEYKRLQPKSWEKISSYDKLYSIIEKHGRGYHDFDDLIKSNYDFKVKFKARLKRDNLIPPLMSNKK